MMEVFQGLHGRHFDFYNLVGKFAVYFVDGLHKETFKNSNKLLRKNNSFYCRMFLRQPIPGLMVSSLFSSLQSWLAGLILCLLPVQYMLSLQKY